ncbi:ABC transporter substrate-binding protein [Frondihabitans australicus]|uniref:Carbohydrate ABC transporter substrate-binding protein (CUT1 family) n=1 Tax=Frondihabitans australicus TaxID=386892 RepID=A0A495II90_9MICO|nr:sugar ABC transporter substrate-binding protein [Frondihabitans australicus]RKR74826.1 carbohydrate ABC transporter substrate-binding protein (CUT1 family) [Frondihabitans australicus]
MKTSTITRRGLLAGTVGAAATAVLAACASTPGPVAAGGPAGSRATGTKVTGTLTFAYWGGSSGETAGFAEIKRRFEERNPGTEIILKVLPYTGFFSSIDRGIVSNTAPDLFRVDYTSIGKYISHGVLLDVTPYFSRAETEAFLPAFWNSVTYDDRAWGVPHQTDTTAIVYSKKAFETAGIGAVPDRLEDAWSWEEFSTVAAKLRASLPASKYPFAYDWTAAGAYRWSSFLYQAGGSLLSADLKRPALPSSAAAKALDFTKSFFTKKWVPANNTIKTTVYSDNFFLNQTAPMSFIGDFLVPEIADKANGYQGGEWSTTFMPRDETAASDLGGNAIVGWKGTKNPDLAAAFMKFLVSEDSMKRFCESATELPTLRTLAAEMLDYPTRPDSLAVFTKQATTITDVVVKETTVPAFASISTTLQDELELGLHGGSSESTLRAIASGIREAIGA